MRHALVRRVPWASTACTVKSTQIRCFYCSSNRDSSAKPAYVPPDTSNLADTEKRMQNILDNIKIKRTPLNEVIQSPDQQNRSKPRAGNEKFKYETYTHARKEAKAVAEIFHKKGVKQNRTENELSSLLAQSFALSPDQDASAAQNAAAAQDMQDEQERSNFEEMYASDEQDEQSISWREQFDPFYQGVSRSVVTGDNKSETERGFDPYTDSIKLEQEPTTENDIKVDQSFLDKFSQLDPDSRAFPIKTAFSDKKPATENRKDVRSDYDPFLAKVALDTDSEQNKFSGMSFEDLLESSYVEPSEQLSEEPKESDSKKSKKRKRRKSKESKNKADEASAELNVPAAEEQFKSAQNFPAAEEQSKSAQQSAQNFPAAEGQSKSSQQSAQNFPAAEGQSKLAQQGFKDEAESGDTENSLKNSLLSSYKELMESAQSTEPVTQLSFQELLHKSYNEEAIAVAEQQKQEQRRKEELKAARRDQYYEGVRASQQPDDVFSQRDYQDYQSGYEGVDFRSQPIGQREYRDARSSDGYNRSPRFDPNSVDNRQAFMFGKDRLNIFEPADLSAETVIVPSIWNLFYAQDIETLVKPPVRNGFDEMVRLTEENKLWKFPIDNEQGVFPDELNVQFHEHLFLDKYCEGFPQHERIQKFMKVVCLGLSKNPYMTLQMKTEHIEKFRTYFEAKFELLKKTSQIEDELNQ